MLMHGLRDSKPVDASAAALTRIGADMYGRGNDIAVVGFAFDVRKPEHSGTTSMHAREVDADSARARRNRSPNDRSGNAYSGMTSPPAHGFLLGSPTCPSGS